MDNIFRDGLYFTNVYCIDTTWRSRIVPLLYFSNAAGHFNYTKCARLSLQDLQEYTSWMSDEEYYQFFIEGRAVIRRFDAKWGGNELVVEGLLIQPWNDLLVLFLQQYLFVNPWKYSATLPQARLNSIN